MKKLLAVVVLCVMVFSSCSRISFSFVPAYKVDNLTYNIKDSVYWVGVSYSEHLNRLNGLTDQDALTQFALREVIPYVRNEAVSRITDQVSLECIATYDPEPKIRAHAFSKITVKTIAMNLRFKEKDKQVLRFIEKQFSSDPLETPGFIQSEDLAQQKIAYTDVDPNKRMIAVKKLTTQAFVETVAKHDASPAVREVAVKRLIDKEVLKELSETDKDERVREAASSRLTDIQILS
jgi:hypothetical protein